MYNGSIKLPAKILIGTSSDGCQLSHFGVARCQDRKSSGKCHVVGGVCVRARTRVCVLLHPFISLKFALGLLSDWLQRNLFKRPYNSARAKVRAILTPTCFICFKPKRLYGAPLFDFSNLSWSLLEITLKHHGDLAMLLLAVELHNNSTAPPVLLWRSRI